MSTEVRWRRGTTAQHNLFTGALGEVTVDTDKNTLVVHDGVKAGGHPIENGNFSASGTGAVTRTVTEKLRDIVNVKDFGAVGNGVVDDTLAIQRAIDSLPATGGVVQFPSGRFRVTSTINVGNGTNSNIDSRTSIRLEGSGAAPFGGGLKGTTLLWDGVTGGTLLSYNGTGEAYGLYNINLDCNLKAATGLAIYSARQSKFSNFSVRKFTGVGVLLGIRTGPTNAVLYASGNVFENFFITSEVTTGVTGLQITGQLPAGDWHRSTFIGGIIQVAKATTGASYGMVLGFTDSNTFIECDIGTPSGGGTGYGIHFDAREVAGYPQNNFFYGCSIASTTVTETASNKILDNFFYAHTLKDQEATPSHAMLRGITDNGQFFGNFKFQKVVEAPEALIKANSSNVILSNANGNSRWRILNNSSDSATYGFAISESNNNGAWVNRIWFKADGSMDINLPVLGQRQVYYGDPDSAGTGYRTLRILN